MAAIPSWATLANVMQWGKSPGSGSTSMDLSCHEPGKRGGYVRAGGALRLSGAHVQPAPERAMPPPSAAPLQRPGTARAASARGIAYARNRPWAPSARRNPRTEWHARGAPLKPRPPPCSAHAGASHPPSTRHRPTRRNRAAPARLPWPTRAALLPTWPNPTTAPRPPRGRCHPPRGLAHGLHRPYHTAPQASLVAGRMPCPPRHHPALRACPGTP
mmetsp:Transcript_45333/g.144511  ORF Transcript_45333/g.144511 Transcript_45333/m.144511 type:complete len:216 (-) Transcript_45333:103-750(-)